MAGKRYDVKVKVISQKGTCVYEHKVGDEWIVSGKSPAGLCLFALHGMYPSIRGLMFGAVYPWAADPDTAQVACPDGENPVVFELRRLK